MRAVTPGSVEGSPRVLLRLEGAAVLALCLVLYRRAELGWTWFLVLFLAPDLSLLGYLRGPRAGAAAYNAVHSYVGPLLLGTGALVQGSGAAAAVALIWAAHIGLDRALGFGLKYRSGFKHTHLGLLGGTAPG